MKCFGDLTIKLQMMVSRFISKQIYPLKMYVYFTLRIAVSLDALIYLANYSQTNYKAITLTFH